METTTKQQVIEKIKKCLKLGKGTGFQGEADQALAAAMRLAASIGMTVDEIKLDGEAENPSSQIGQNTVGAVRSKIPQWEGILATGIAHAIGCELVIHSGWNEKLQKRAETFLLIGTQEDAVLFGWLYPFIISQLRRLCHRDWDNWSRLPSNMASKPAGYRKAWERSWYRGASFRVIETAQVKFKEQTTEQEQQQYALVVRSKMERVQQFMSNQMNVRESKHRPQQVDRSAMSYGYESAKEVTMNRPIETEARKRVC